MNLIDGYVTKVLGVEEFDANEKWNITDKNDPCYGKRYILFKVEYTDEGGTHTTNLCYEKGKEPEVKKGFRFPH